MNTNSPFTPGVGSGYNATITGSGSSQSVPLTAGSGALRIAVSGNAIIAWASGKGSATAVITTNCVVLPGATEVFAIPNDHDTVAVISTGAGSTIYLNRGE